MSSFFAWKYCTAPINGNFIVMYFEQTVNVRLFNCCFCFRFWQETDRNPVAGICAPTKTGMRDGTVAEKKVIGPYRSVKNTSVVGRNFPKGGNQLPFGRKPEKHDINRQSDTGRHLLQDEKQHSMSAARIYCGKCLQCNRFAGMEHNGETAYGIIILPGNNQRISAADLSVPYRPVRESGWTQ